MIKVHINKKAIRTIVAFALILLFSSFEAAGMPPKAYRKYGISIRPHFFTTAATDSTKLLYTNEKYFFSFTYPISWSIMTPEEVTQKTQGHFNVGNALVFVVNERDFDCNINIQVIPYENADPSISELNDLRNNLDDQYSSSMPGYKRISSKIIELNGLYALEIVMEAKRLDLTLRQKVVLFVKNRHGYTFTFTSPKLKYDHSDDQCFSLILSTLKVN